MPSDNGTGSRPASELSDAEKRELKQGLIATVVGVGVDDVAARVLIQQLSTDTRALDPVIQLSLSDPARLAALHSTGLMDNGQSSMLDNVALLTAEALATPFAAVSLLDDSRELLAGCNVADSDFERLRPADLSIGKFTVVSGIPFIVDDATEHPLLANLPLVLSGEVGATPAFRFSVTTMTRSAHFSPGTPTPSIGPAVRYSSCRTWPTWRARRSSTDRYDDADRIFRYDAEKSGARSSCADNSTALPG